MTEIFIVVGQFGNVLALIMGSMFIIGQLAKDNSLIDIAYGPTFLIALGATIYLTRTYEFLPLMIAGATGLWALRLGTRLYIKNRHKPEDPRYAAWRTDWMKKGKAYFIVRSFFQIYVLQGIVILLVSLPAILVVAFPDDYSLPFIAAGLGVFFFGLLYETIADWQLDQFLARKKASTESAVLLTTGLFSYSRRPNYFGETLVWWGFAIVALPLPFGWLGLISPLLITYIVTKVTGPMLERIFLQKHPNEYGEYARSVNYFVPSWLVKKR